MWCVEGLLFVFPVVFFCWFDDGLQSETKHKHNGKKQCRRRVNGTRSKELDCISSGRRESIWTDEAKKEKRKKHSNKLPKSSILNKVLKSYSNMQLQNQSNGLMKHFTANDIGCECIMLYRAYLVSFSLSLCKVCCGMNSKI